MNIASSQLEAFNFLHRSCHVLYLLVRVYLRLHYGVRTGLSLELHLFSFTSLLSSILSKLALLVLIIEASVMLGTRKRLACFPRSSDETD